MNRFSLAITNTLLRIIEGLPLDELRCLIFPNRHMPLLDTRRATIIISRVRMVSALFAILTPLWIVVDWWAFPTPLWQQLAVGRAISSIMLMALALSWRSSTRMRDAYMALVVMFLVPTTFYIFSHLLLAEYHLQGIAHAVQSGYAFLPFVLVAGVSVFPLSAIEGIILAMPAFLAEALPLLVKSFETDAISYLAMFWLLAVIAVVATLAAMSQIGFMITLVRQAIRDPLTGIFSRSSGEELLEIQYIISMRTNTPLSIAFFDLDNFKSINDQYGHEAGDQVLIAMTEQIRRNLRTGDMLARWGGEEFVLILPNTYPDTAIHVLERLRTHGLGTRPDSQPITASIGVAERLTDGCSEWRALVEIADQRMYDAKQSGKDRIVGPLLPAIETAAAA